MAIGDSIPFNSADNCPGCTGFVVRVSLDADNIPDWPKMNRRCAVASAAKYRPQYEKLFAPTAARK